MPLLEKMQTKARQSWNKASARFEASVYSNSSKKGVRFSTSTQRIDCDYAITDSIKESVWYQRDELLTIKKDSEKLVNEAVAGKRRTSSEENCHRGLEKYIRDKTCGTSVHKERYRAFTQGFLQVQENQRAQGKVDREYLRKLSCQHSKKAREVAELLASRDALCALRIYKNAYHWKLPQLETCEIKIPDRQIETLQRRVRSRPATPRRTNSSRAA